jgi:hypothetical protein
MLCISCNDFGIDKEAFSTPLNVISLDFCNWKSQTWTKDTETNYYMYQDRS